jgi:hypothetical protein
MEPQIDIFPPLVLLGLATLLALALSATVEAVNTWTRGPR